MNITDVFEHDLRDRKSKVWAEIRLDALIRNYKKIFDRVKKASPESEIICVIKADAYGHGAVKSMEALISAGARVFAVSSVAEAIELRLALEESACNEKTDILILGYSRPEEVDLIYKYNIIQTIFSLEYAKALEFSCKQKLDPSQNIRVHLKLDTGMNRIGFRDVDDIRKVFSLTRLVPEGIFTHLACADEPENEMTARQCNIFEAMVSLLEKEGICPKMRHILNSAGILSLDDKMYDAVRPGIILYGLMPSDFFEPSSFEAVMSLKSVVAHIHTVECGESISYGARFTAERRMKVATVPIGYADGFIRAYTGAYVKVGTQKCPIVGRICMDQCMIDVTDADVSLGDTVVLFESTDDIHELARLANTIDYEVTCGISKRVPRVYIEERI